MSRFLIALTCLFGLTFGAAASPEPWYRGGQIEAEMRAAFAPGSCLAGTFMSASTSALAIPNVRVESNYNCGARSHANARGIMQVLPATARGEGVGGNLYNCATGLEAGMRYLRKIVVAHGTSCAALSLYERGIYARPVCTGYGRKAVRLASA